MATITTNTQLKLISQLSDIGNIGGDDLILVQRGLKSYKSNYSNFINGLPDNSTIEVSGGKLSVKSTPLNTSQIVDGSISIQKLGELSENTVIGNLAGGDNPEEIGIETSITGSEKKLVTSSAILSYIEDTLSDITSSINQLAILEEQRPNGVYADGATVERDLTPTVYDSKTYEETINTQGANNHKLQFVQRNINTMVLNQGTIVENFNGSGRNFRLKPGTYYIKAKAWADDHIMSLIRLKRHNVADTQYGTKYISYVCQTTSDDRRTVTYFDCILYVDGSDSENKRTFSFEQGLYEHNMNTDLGRPYQLGSLPEVYFRAEFLKIG